MVAVSKVTQCLFGATLSVCLPDSVFLIRKLILSNGLFGTVARVAACLFAVMNNSWSYGRFHSLGKLHFSHFHCCDSSLLLLLFPSARLFIVLFCCLFSFSVIFSLCLTAWLSIYFLFLSASPALLCQHFTLDIQLLAGHSIVIPFRATPFSAGLKQPFKLHPRLPSELPLCKMLFSNISGATT